MKDFKKGNKFGGGNRSGGNFGKSDFGRPKQMFTAVCANCGKPCEVPFRPTGDRPVYCRDCFGSTKFAPPRGGDNRDARRGPGHISSFTPRVDAPRLPVMDSRIDEIRKRIDAIDSKLDRILQVIDIGPKEEERIDGLKKAIKKAAPKKAVSKKKK
jgi:CxxC-x17-CxxC domain-containing protein